MELCGLCEKGNYEKVLHHLKNSTKDINRLVSTHRVHKAPLHYACEYGHVKIAKQLIHFGADISIPSSDKRTCLHYACLGGHHELLKYLIEEFTGGLNQTDINGQTALHIACYHGEEECVKVLLNPFSSDASKMVDYMSRDKSGKTCCEVALMTDQSAVLKVFLSSPHCGDSITQNNPSNGQTILHVAAKYNAINCIQLIIKSRLLSVLNIADNKGMLPCHIAAHHGNVDALQLLLDNKTFIHTVDNDNRTVGHFTSLAGSLSCIHWLLSNNINTTMRDVHGNTMMHYSGKSSSCGELVNCFVNHGAVFDIQNDNGETPIEKARKYGHPVAFQAGLSGKAKCNMCNERRAKKPKQSILNKNIQTQKSLLFSSLKV